MRSANNWPRSDYASMKAFYGEVGKNQTRLSVPYPLRLAWAPEKRVNRITVHRKVAESMDKVLSTVLFLYGREEIERLHLDQWGGCLNVRMKRGGSTWSTHAWGAANDWNPADNALRTPWHRASFSSPAYIDFFNAWIYEGWNPLGISWNRDAMHIEATANNVQPLQSHQLLNGMAQVA